MNSQMNRVKAEDDIRQCKPQLDTAIQQVFERFHNTGCGVCVSCRFSFVGTAQLCYPKCTRLGLSCIVNTQD